jgi:hypothetical protein
METYWTQELESLESLMQLHGNVLREHKCACKDGSNASWVLRLTWTRGFAVVLVPDVYRKPQV